MSVLPVGFGSSGGLQITNSVRLRAAASAYFSRTFGSPTSSTVYTWVFGVKRGKITSGCVLVQGYLNANNYGHIRFKADDTLEWREFGAAANNGQVHTNAVFRDPSAHSQIIVTRNGTTVTIYANGTTQTLTTDVAIAAGGGYLSGNATAHRIGHDQVNADYFDGYLSDVYFIDGQALAPSSFGETNSDGVWVPKGYNGTYGANGFHLDFKDAALTAGSNAGLGKDVSGNGNYWTTNNISVTAGVTYDSMVDTPTNNYATLSSIDKASNTTISDGNLKTENTNALTTSTCKASAAFDVGSATGFTWEVLVNSANNTNHAFAGADPASAAPTAGYTLSGAVAVVASGEVYKSGVLQGTYLSWTTNDIIKFWMGSGNLYYSVNDVPANSGSAVATGLSGDYVAADFRASSSAVTNSWVYNFGQRPFTYTPPTGFKALCTANLPAVAITKPARYFNAKTRTGTGASFNVTGEAFAPDLVWSKGRSGATDHALYDAVRGVQKDIGTNLATDETTQAQGLTAFNSDGFTGGTLAKINTNAATYIDWMWKESITAGFDIVAVTGNGANRTVAHNLGAVPKMIIGKSLTTAGADTGWPVYHASLANTEYLKLETTAAKATGATYWNSTTPTSAVFSLGTAADVNTNADTYIYYAFAEIPGYSKFGSYVGNGSADGPFVYCGFRPKYVLIKKTNTTSNWIVVDSERQGYNVMGPYLNPNLSVAETTSTTLFDFTANGFKMRYSDSGTYIFAAFAEMPSGGSNVSPAPAR